MSSFVSECRRSEISLSDRTVRGIGFFAVLVG